jgi:Fe-S cluster biogenesis protein NfuA
MSEMIEKLNKALESIRPYLKEDGGDVEVLSLDELGVVKIKMIGNLINFLSRRFFGKKLNIN